MMAKDSVKKRLSGEARDGMSFTEFTYQLLQGYDFLYLYEHKGCTLQMGGADQWGNSIMGIELVRKKLGKEVFVLSTSLITDSNGNKIGKSAGNAVWVNEDKTSPYEYYQYFRNTPDDLVEKFLKIFTEIPLDEIARLSALQGAEINQAKKVLAFAATEITPSPPRLMSSTVRPSSPERTRKLLGRPSMICCICSTLPHASFIATILSVA